MELEEAGEVESREREAKDGIKVMACATLAFVSNGPTMPPRKISDRILGFRITK